MATAEVPPFQLRLHSQAEPQVRGSTFHERVVPGIWVGLAVLAVILTTPWTSVALLVAAALSLAIMIEGIFLVRDTSGANPQWMLPGLVLAVLVASFAFDFPALAKDGGGSLLVLLFGSTFIADITAFYAGRYLGRIHIAGQISPNKTLEGLAAGWLAAILVAVCTKAAVGLPVAWLPLIGLTITLATIGFAGDILESWFKRCLGVKDSGTLLRGMGGLLDRCDDLILVTPCLLFLVVHHVL